jgi:hypothetical protein
MSLLANDAGDTDVVGDHRMLVMTVHHWDQVLIPEFYLCSS